MPIDYKIQQSLPCVFTNLPNLLVAKCATLLSARLLQVLNCLHYMSHNVPGILNMFKIMPRLFNFPPWYSASIYANNNIPNRPSTLYLTNLRRTAQSSQIW